MDLKKLLENIDYIEIHGENYDLNISGIAYDSRKVNEGMVFICIKGFQVDGHEFAKSAAEKGAVALIVERRLDISSDIVQIVVKNTRKALAKLSSTFYNHPSKKMNLIGVTGTNGKTSTTFLTKAVLDQIGQKVGLIGTIENRIGDTVLKTERTTPESLELQQLFYEMNNQGVDSVVMEVSSHSLALERVEECDFNVGIFTNLTQDHLDFHGTMENYLKEKTKLFKKCKVGIVNIDDSASASIIKESTCNIITYGIHHDADIKAKNIHISAKGVSFDISIKSENLHIDFQIPGKFSVYNALAALGACYALEIPLDKIKEGLEAVRGVAGRCESIETHKDFAVIVDYAHTPDGLENILQTINEFTLGRKITVFGCGGDRDKTKRPIMGEIAAKLSDFVVITSDNPRTEDPEKILDDIEVGVKRQHKSYVRIADRKEAIQYAVAMAKKNDVILIAGKGHESYQILKDKVIHFDDKEVAKKSLQGE